MAPVNLHKASEFIESLDDRILRSRFESIMKNHSPKKSTVDTLEKTRKSDGGFAFWDEDISSLTTTVNVVGWFDDLGLQMEPIVDKTFDFLLQHQQEDGGWDEIREIKKLNPPPYMIPGEISTRTWLTASCAHWFIRFGRAEPPGSRGCPAEFLMRHIQPSGLIKGYLYASWDSLVMFHYHPGVESNVYKILLKAVKNRFEPEKHDAADLAWFLRCLRDANLDSKDTLVVRTLDILESLQQDNGSWNSAEGTEYTGMVTVDAIRVLRDFGRAK